MPPLSVSEKTLELNLVAELLELVRARSGCNSAFWIGMKQDQEFRNGIDELIANVPRGLHLALQFKAPRARPKDAYPYRFSINDRQNGHLLRLSRTRPNAVLYVLPHYNTFARVRADSPSLLAGTWFLPVERTRPLPASTRSGGTHDVRSSPPSVEIRSEPTFVETLTAAQALEGLFGEGRAREPSEFGLISHEELREWVYTLGRVEQGNRRAIGQRLRGLSTVCLDF